MAFTASEILDIVKIVGIEPEFLDAHLAGLGATFVTRVEDAVRAEITLWNDGIGAKNVKLHPTESNYGVETNSGDAKGTVIRNIARLLQLSYALPATGMGTLQIGT